MLTNDVTRLFTRWFSHPQHGVEAMLALVPRARPGVVGDDPMPTMPAIYDDVDTRGIAGSDISPPSLPALVIYSGVPSRSTQERGDRRVEKVSGVILTAGYLTGDVDEQFAVRDAGHVLRAVHWSARRMNDQRSSDGYREVNGVAILEVGTVSEYPVAGAVGVCRLWGMVQFPVKVAYTTP